MSHIEEKFYNTDFSKHTDLKERLAARLFQSSSSEKVTPFSFRELSEDDLTMVNAAQGIFPEDPEDPKAPQNR